MKRPLLGILGVWILGEMVAMWLGIALVPATSLDRAMAGVDSADVVVCGSVDRFRRTSTGFSYELADCRVILSGTVLSTHHVLVFTNDISELEIGNEVEVTGELSSFDEPSNPGQFDQNAYYRAQGIDYALWEDAVQVSDDSCLFVLQRIWEFREALREQLLCIAPEEDAGVYLSMFLGDRSSMDSEVKAMYQNGGIAHILAISGLHISLFGMALYRLMKKIGCPAWGNLLISGSVMSGYVWMTGGAASSLRALCMFGAFLLAQVLGRTYDQLSALSLAGILLLAEYPLLLMQSGFQLSFLAMAGVAWAWPLCSRWWELRKWKREKEARLSSDLGESKYTDEAKRKEAWRANLGDLLGSLAFALVIQLMTLPVIANSYYVIPTYSVLLNLIVLPLTGLLLGTVAVTALGMQFFTWGWENLGWLLPAGAGTMGSTVGSRAILIARAVLLWYEKLCRLVDLLPGAYIVTGDPEGWSIAVYYLILLMGFGILRLDIRRLKEEKHRIRVREIGGSVCAREGKLDVWLRRLSDLWIKSAVGANIGLTVEVLRSCLSSASVPICMGILWLVILIRILCIPCPEELRITLLDIGQGDCICIQTPDGHTCLIDGGSTTEKKIGTYRILPFLKSQGIDHLDAIFVTHGDEDHYSGLAEVLEDAVILVDRLCLTETSLVDEELSELRTAAEACGTELRQVSQGDCWEWGDVHFRCIYPSDAALADWEEDKNNSSMVLTLEYEDFTALFTGDLAEEGEQELIGEGLLPKNLDFLKVGHHGSKYSSSEEFLEVLHPEFAGISVGSGNRYGHPTPEVLERLEAVKAEIHRTDEDGAMMVRVKEANVIVEDYHGSND